MGGRSRVRHFFKKGSAPAPGYADFVVWGEGNMKG
jgi:hypothetical protein